MNLQMWSGYFAKQWRERGVARYLLRALISLTMDFYYYMQPLDFQIDPIDTSTMYICMMVGNLHKVVMFQLRTGEDISVLENLIKDDSFYAHCRLQYVHYCIET